MNLSPFLRTSDPRMLFSVLAVIVLLVVWTTTLHLIRVENNSADNSARVSSRELAETYEAHVVRALRELDQTLRVVKFAYEAAHDPQALTVLRQRDLLPPELLFRTSLIDASGQQVGSTGSAAPLPEDTVQSLLAAQRESDHFAVSSPQRTAEGDWQLLFSRRLDDASGEFAGIAIVAVDADFFVSAYEPQKLGSRGTLGLLGRDGVFRAQRTNDIVSAGGRTDYDALLQPMDASETASALIVNTWDGVRRYTSARELYGYPLAIVVGLSADEQLEQTRQRVRRYVALSALASMLLCYVVFLLGRMSWRLMQSERRESAARVAAARQAGMSEIATNVLHNVGNVLTSVNVSAEVMAQAVRQSKVQGLQRAMQMIREHRDDLGQFLSVDEKGRLLPGYLDKLAEALIAEQRQLLQELGHLASSIDHIQETVATQQSLAGTVSLFEPVPLDQLIGEALRLTTMDLRRLNIQVVQRIAALPTQMLDRHRLLLILVNLINNAKDAIVARENSDGNASGCGEIAITVELSKARRLRFMVSDNGEGIAADQLTRIFTHGYSTRGRGRGFGLHSCALAAADFGGTLAAFSGGPGCGSVFTLEFPVGSAHDTAD